MFDTFIERILKHEGGYTNNPKDAGNWTGGKVNVGVLKGTKYGIAANTYPQEDIKNLTLERAKELYRRDFWKRNNLDLLPPAVGFQVLDAAINHGPRRAVQWLQECLKVTADGVLGPKTATAAHATPIDRLIFCYNARRLDFYTSLSSFATFGVGWTRRVAENLRYAAHDH